MVFDRRSGALLKRLPTRGAVEAPITIEPLTNDLFAGDAEGYVYRFQSNGSLVWEYETTGPVVSAPAIGDDKVFFHAIDGALIALDATSGKPVWSYRREGPVSDGLTIFGASVPLVASGMVISGFADGSVVALRTADGQLVWEHAVVKEGAWTDVDGDPVLAGDDRLVISGYDGTTVCLKLDSGEELWRARQGGASQPLLLGDTLYLSDMSGNIVAASVATGEQLWRWSIPGGAIARKPVFWRGSIVVTTSHGGLFIIDPGTGLPRWKLAPREEIMGFSSTVAIGDSDLFAVSDGGFLYALGAPDYDAPVSPSRSGAWRWPWERSKSRSD